MLIGLACVRPGLGQPKSFALSVVLSVHSQLLILQDKHDFPAGEKCVLWCVVLVNTKRSKVLAGTVTL